MVRKRASRPGAAFSLGAGQTPVVQNQVPTTARAVLTWELGARCLGRSSTEMLGTLGTRTAGALPAWPVAREGSFISGSAPRISRDTALSWSCLARTATRPGSPTSQLLQQRRQQQRQQQFYTAVPCRHTRCLRVSAPHAPPRAGQPALRRPHAHHQLQLRPRLGCTPTWASLHVFNASKVAWSLEGVVESQGAGFQRAGLWLCRAHHLSPIGAQTLHLRLPFSFHALTTIPPPPPPPPPLQAVQETTAARHALTARVQAAKVAMELAQAQDSTRVAELEAQRAAGEKLRAQVCLLCTCYALAVHLPCTYRARTMYVPCA